MNPSESPVKLSWIPSDLQWNQMNPSEPQWTPVNPVNPQLKLSESQWNSNEHNQSLGFTLDHHKSHKITVFHLWSLVVYILTHNFWISMNTSDLAFFMLDHMCSHEFMHVHKSSQEFTGVHRGSQGSQGFTGVHNVFTGVHMCSHEFTWDHWCSLRFISYMSRYYY